MKLGLTVEMEMLHTAGSRAGGYIGGEHCHTVSKAFGTTLSCHIEMMGKSPVFVPGAS